MKGWEPVRPPRGAHAWSHAAMNTLFEVIVAGQEPEYGRQAAAAAFAEIDRLERELSRYRSNSDIARINRLRAGQWTRVGLAAFECLQLAAAVWRETEGAFDVACGALSACWRDEQGRPRQPREAEIADARDRSGMQWLVLDESTHAVGVRVDGVGVDLGAIGKGYAIDRVADLLREWSVTRAVIQAGNSTALALDPMLETDG